MKLKIGKVKIRDAVKTAASAADKKGAIPILSNILLEAGEGVLRLTATNLEIGVSTLVNCQVEEEGKTTVNAVKASKLFSSITGEEVELEADGGKLLVKSVNSRFSLSTLPVEEFPELELPEDFSIKLPSEEIDKALKKVSYAAGKDEARFILTGVLLRSFGDRLHAVATDGHRLALYEVFVESEPWSAIIPKKALSELKKLLREGDTVEIVQRYSKIYFRVADTVMWSSLIEGEYPDYIKVIPEDNSKEVVADRQELLSALKEVSVIFDKEEVMAVIFELSEGNLKLSARKAEGEEAEVVIPVDYSGEPFKIGFNIVHMIESISSFEGDTVSLKMEEPTLPVLITSEGDPQLKNVIMPMKV